MLNSGDLGAQEAPGQDGEGLRVAGGGEVMAWFGASGPRRRFLPASAR